MIGISNHGKPYRIHARRWFCALYLGGLSLTAHAGYAQLSPPQGWSAGAGATATYQPPPGGAANTGWYYGRATANATLNFGGRAVTVPASMRMAANAPRIAAGFLWTNPTFAVASIALMAWVALSNIQWDTTKQKWVETEPGDELSNGLRYTMRNHRTTIYQFSGLTRSQACGAALVHARAAIPTMVVQTTTTQCVFSVPGQSGTNAYNFQSTSANACPAGWYVTPGGLCVQDPTTREIPKPEFEERMAPHPLPDAIPPHDLPVRLPVENPVINPKPGPDGVPTPMREPTGNPYRVPNTDPVQYRRPIIQITPSPNAPAEPWRVDVQPQDLPVPSPDPVPVPQPEPEPDPEEDPDAQPENKESDLCEKYPDILACAKPDLDTPEAEIPREQFTVTYSAENLFSSGSCPADKTMMVNGQNVTVWDWQKTCGYITDYLKPVLLTIATFSAFMMLSPGKDV